MYIRIWQTDGGYEASVDATPSHPTPWHTERPMAESELIQALLAEGYHQQDVVDAIVEVDPGWLTRNYPDWFPPNT